MCWTVFAIRILALIISSHCLISIHSIPIILCKEHPVYVNVKMGEKLVSLRKIEDLEFIKMMRKDLGIFGTFFTHFRN